MQLTSLTAISLRNGLSAPPKRARKLKLSLNLLCLPAHLVNALHDSLDLSTTPNDIAKKIEEIKTIWPTRGSLVVEVNAKETWGRTFLPADIVSPVHYIVYLNH